MKNIIVVDMQKGFINDNNRYIVDRINKYLDNNTFDNIIYTRCINCDNSPFSTILDWHNMEDAESLQFAVKLKENSLILTKFCYGISQEQIDILKSRGITETYICGTDIGACVLAIMYDLFDAGIKPILIKDLTSTGSAHKEMIDYALAIMRRQFGKSSIV